MRNYLKRILKHPVVSTVVGGLILTFIIWLFNHRSTVLGWLTKIISELWHLAMIDVSIQIWLLSLLILIGIPFNWYVIKKIHCSVVKLMRGPVVATEKIQITPYEEWVLKLFAKRDGESLSISFIASRTNSKNLIAEKAVESLINKGFVSCSIDDHQDRSYILSSFGRDFVIERDYAY